MAILVTTPQLKLENGESTAFEVVAHTIDYVCSTINPEKNGEDVCKTCPLSNLCGYVMSGYDMADEFRRIAREYKSK